MDNKEIKMTDQDVEKLHILRRGIRGMLRAHVEWDIQHSAAKLASEKFLTTFNWDTTLAHVRAQEIFDEHFPEKE